MIFNCYTPEVLENCITYAGKNGLGMEVKFGPIRKSRAQENYFHNCVGVVAGHIGEDAETTKLRIKYAVLPLEQITLADGKKYMYPQSTTNQPKEVYSKLIDAILMLGTELGLKMPDPSLFGLKEKYQ